MLWSRGQLTYGTDSLGSWGRFTRLLKAAIRGVRGALGPGDSVRIMLQYSQGGSTPGTLWFFDHMDAYSVPYDLIGLSYYPWWHGTLADLTATLGTTAQRYGKDVMVSRHPIRGAPAAMSSPPLRRSARAERAAPTGYNGTG